MRCQNIDTHKKSHTDLFLTKLYLIGNCILLLHIHTQHQAMYELVAIYFYTLSTYAHFPFFNVYTLIITWIAKSLLGYYIVKSHILLCCPISSEDIS